MSSPFYKQYYGIYRAFITESNDPAFLGRVKLKIPQVLGDAETDWVDFVDGAVPQINYPYGTFYTNATQTVSGANTATVADNWVEDDANKTYLSGNKIYVEETGDYYLQFSALFSKNTSNSQEGDIWIRKNGQDINNTDTVFTIAGAGVHAVVTVGLLLDLEAGDYIQFVFSGASASTKLIYHAAASSPTRPACPGIIATLNLVGKYKPKPGTPVWVMFEGGDPNFPVWLGGQA